MKPHEQVFQAVSMFSYKKRMYSLCVLHVHASRRCSPVHAKGVRRLVHVTFFIIKFTTPLLFIRLSLNPNITLCTLLPGILGGFLVAVTVNDVTCNLDVHGVSLKRFV